MAKLSDLENKTIALTNKTIDADNNTLSNLAHGSEVDEPSSGVHGVTGSLVGTSDAQTLTNKSIDYNFNTITNLPADTDTFSTIQVDGTPVSTAAPTLDFDSTDFLLTESPTDDFDVTIVNSGIDHDQTTNYLANEHIDWTSASAGTIDPTNYVDNDTIYTHPNHTGEITSVADGAQTLDKTAISNKGLVTAAVGDHVLIGDLDDSDNLKKVTVQTIVDLASTSLSAGKGIEINSNAIDQMGTWGGTLVSPAADAGLRLESNTGGTEQSSIVAFRDGTTPLGATNYGEWLIVQNPVANQSTSIIGGQSASATTAGDFNALSGSNSSTGDSGILNLSSGSTDSGDSGLAKLKSGDSTSGNSGNVNIETGASGATRGKIELKDGSEGTPGNVWTEGATAGEGSWAAPAAGGDLWSDAVDSDILPTGNDSTFDLGSASAKFAETHSDKYLVETSGEISLTVQAVPNVQSLNGDGTNNGTATAPMSTTINDNYTSSFWFKSNGSATGQDTVHGQDVLAGAYGPTWFYGTSSRLQILYANPADGLPGTGYKQYDTATSLNDSTWHHIVSTFAAGVVKIYVDGVSDEVLITGSADTTFYDNGNPYTFLKSQLGTLSTNARMDEATVWNVAFSQADVDELYDSVSGKSIDAQTHSKSANLLAYWQFEDTPTTLPYSIVDSTGTQANGTVSASTSYTIAADAPALLGASAVTLASVTNEDVSINSGTGSISLTADANKAVLTAQPLSATNDLSIATTKYVDDNAGVIPLGTKGDLFTYTTVDFALPIGTDTHILTADSAEASGMKWAANAGSGDLWSDPVDANIIPDATDRDLGAPGSNQEFRNAYIQDVYLGNTGATGSLVLLQNTLGSIGTMEGIASGVSQGLPSDATNQAAIVLRNETVNDTPLFIYTVRSPDAGISGKINIEGGNTERGSAGPIQIRGGFSEDSTAANGNGGSVTIIGGDTASDGTGTPGDITLDAGSLSTTGSTAKGGEITLTAGNSVDGDAGDIELTAGTSSGTGADGHILLTSDQLGFYGTTPVTQATALTASETTITHTAPGAPDYAIQDMTNTSPYGFVTQDEANTVLQVIANLQTRVDELEAALDASTGVGIIG